MSHKDGVMLYNLTRPIKYSNSGNFEEAHTLYFSEFLPDHSRFYMKLKQMIDKAIMDVSQKANDMRRADDPNQTSEHPSKPSDKFINKSEEDHEKETSDIAEFLSMSLSIREDDDTLNKFLDVFSAMATKGICRIENNNLLLPNHWKEIHPEDQINAATRYCAFFGIGFLGQMKEGSETALEQPTPVKEL